MASGESGISSSFSRCSQESYGSASSLPRLNEYSYRLRRGRLASNLCTAINRQLSKGYSFIKDVIPNVGFEEGQNIVDVYNQYPAKQKTAIFILAYHPQETENHWHLYHSCSYNQSNCRHQFLKVTNVKRRRPSDIIRGHPLQTEHIENIIEYLLQRPRELFHIQINADSYVSEIHRLKDLRSSVDLSRIQPKGQLETCQLSLQDGDREREQSNEQQDSQQSYGIEKYVNSRDEEIPWSGNTKGGIAQRLKIVDYLLKHMVRYLVVPIENTCQLENWQQNPILSMFNNSHNDYKLAVNNFYCLTANLPFQKIIELHQSVGDRAIYSARSNEHYFNLEESIFHVEELLKFQYQDGISEFLNRLFNLTEKRIPKKNAMFILGKNNTLHLSFSSNFIINSMCYSYRTSKLWKKLVL